MGNCIPADQHALGRYDMELLVAGIRIKPGALDQTCIDGETLCTFVAVKEPEPGDPSLAHFTLAVIKHKSSISHNPPSLQLYGHSRDACYGRNALTVQLGRNLGIPETWSVKLRLDAYPVHNDFYFVIPRVVS